MPKTDDNFYNSFFTSLFNGLPDTFVQNSSAAEVFVMEIDFAFFIHNLLSR